MSDQTITRPPLRQEVIETLRLAGPAIVARAGMLLMSIADTVMVGHYATTDLAYLGIAWSLSTTLLIANIGFLMGTLVKTSHAFGRGEFEECGRVWRRSLPLATLVGFGGFALCLLSEPLLLVVGQSAEIAREGAIVAIAYGAGLPAIAIAVACQFFLEGIKRPLPAMYAMLIANILNVGLNAVMIYGTDWFPTMGAEGAAWATTIARTLLAVIAVGYILLMWDRRRFAITERLRRDWPAQKEQLKIGLATGVALIAEATAFNGLTQMAGLLGVAALGAFSATINVLAGAFMAAVGIGVATSVRVGAAWGPGDRRGAERAGWIGLAVNSLAMALIAVLLAPTASNLAGAYGLGDEAQAMAADAMQVAGIVILADGAQAVLSNALRARGDVWPTTLLQISCFWGVMLPVAWALTFMLEWGPVGLVAGVGVGAAASATALIIRFKYLAARDRRMGY
jgi:MATE family multidrug resistance protein